MLFRPYRDERAFYFLYQGRVNLVVRASPMLLTLRHWHLTYAFNNMEPALDLNDA